MLTAVFDASGTDHDQEWLVVAGYLSSAREWSQFSRDWLATLYPETAFHAAEYRYRMGSAYESSPLVQGLVGLAQSLRYKCISIVRISNFSALSEESKERYRLNAYALAARSCMGNLGEWCWWRGIPSHEIKWVFERGDLGWERLQELLKREGRPLPIFKSKRDRFSKKDGSLLEKAFVPLQAADLLAHEAFRANKYGIEHSPILSDLEVVPGRISRWAPEDIAQLDRYLSDITESHGGEYRAGF